MVDNSYILKRGDIIKISFMPVRGHEQGGYRPGIVISDENFNKKTGLAFICPITTRVKGYPFEVLIPENDKIEGVVLVDQLRTMDWNNIAYTFICEAEQEVIDEIIEKIEAIIK